MSFERIVNIPRRKIGDVTLQKILQQNKTDETDLLETIVEISKNKSRSFSSSVKTSLLEFSSVCSTIKRMITEQVNDLVFRQFPANLRILCQEEVPKIIEYVLDAIQYKDYLKEHYKDHEGRWNNIGELISVSRNTANGGDKSLTEDDQLQSIVLVKDEDDEEPGRNSMADFLEYCTLCSNQKELEEGEGGVKHELCDSWPFL